MEWTNIKDKWPESNSFVVICYYDIYEWVAEVIHEKWIEDCKSNEIYWMSLPELPQCNERVFREKEGEFEGIPDTCNV